MALIGACKDGWTALRHSPGLVVAGLLVAAVGQFSTVGEVVDSPVVSGLTGVGYFLAFPFVLGGTVGMALAAVRGADASLAEFVRAGRANYARMLVALFLFVVILLVAVMGTFSFGFVALVALVVLGPVGQDAAFGTGVFLFAGSVALTLVGLALVVLFLQFFGPAIVVEDEGALASLSRSATVVRANLGSAAVFTVLFVGTNTLLAPDELVGLVLPDATLATPLADAPDPVVLATLPVLLVVAAVGFAYLYTVQTAFYVRLVEGTAGDDGGRAADRTAPVDTETPT